MAALLADVHVHGHTSAAAFASLATMWLGMMGVMMAPTVWPWVRAFERLACRGDGRLWRIMSTLSFASGYLAAWAAYAVAAAFVHLVLLRAGALDPVRGLAPLLGAGVLIVAGLFQFAPPKRACLTHCRNPVSYFLSRWRNGPTGGFRLGFGHGLFCVGCCWALMATALAVGVMNLWWMAALTAAVFVEQVAPRGEWIRAPLGLALIAGGLLRA
jgi:predicted metal-binding membrane protein